jgi:type IV pilus assembly protein PilO
MPVGNLPPSHRRMYIVVAALVVLDLAALLFLFSPLGTTRRSAERDYQTTRQRLRAKADETGQYRGMDTKLVDARQEIDGFFKDRFASQGSDIISELGKVASANRVRISQGKYDVEDTDIAGLQRVRIEAILDGDYVETVKFINALERDKMFFIIDSVTLGEQQAGKVRLNMKLETYLKGQA